MFIPNSFPKDLKHQEDSLTCRFCILVWNIHKENQQHKFQKKFTQLLKECKSDIFMLQEVQFSKKDRFFLNQYSFAIAPNMETHKNIFGVLTATKSSFKEISTNMSSKKEMGFVTHKSFLITKHFLCNGEFLYLVNIHAINFVTVNSFAHELKRIKDILLRIDGAIIIGGDFNSWSKKRTKVIDDFMEELDLRKVDVDEFHHVKHIFLRPIDHLYYRGVELIEARAIDTQKVSDHNPIYATFGVL